eukprot:3812995-Pyramimonas_sp.AAC.1
MRIRMRRRRVCSTCGHDVGDVAATGGGREAQGGAPAERSVGGAAGVRRRIPGRWRAGPRGGP